MKKLFKVVILVGFIFVLYALSSCNDKSYKVTFKDYDGSIIAEKTMTIDGIDVPEPEREGYTFIKWDKDFYRSSKNIEVTAIYEIKKYSVVFKDDYGLIFSIQSVEHGSDAIAPSIQTRPGYDLIGWDKSFKNVTSDLEIKALYNVQKYTVSFISNGGNEIEDIKNLTYGSTIELPIPKKEGYMFKGWYVGNNVNSGLFTSTNQVTSDLVLYARWEHYNIGAYRLSYDKNVNKYIIAKYEGYEEEVIIPDSYNNIEIYKIGESAFIENFFVQSISMPNNILYIGQAAFYNCINLESIQLSDNLIGLGSDAFYNCTRLNNVTIPSGIETLSNTVFGNCTSLTNINLPNGLKTIDNGAFSYCTKLSNINIPSSVNIINNSAFYNCSSLKVITIPDNVTTIANYVFYNCTKLETINISQNSKLSDVGNFAFTNTAWYNNQPDGVIYINKIAYKYKGVMPLNHVEIILPGTIAISPYAFANCSTLNSINLSDSLIVIGEASFYNCSSLTSIDLPLSLAKIGPSAFSYCTNLVYIDIPSSVNNIGEFAFSDCYNLTIVDIPENINLVNIGAQLFENTSWFNNQPDGLIYIAKIAYTYKGNIPSNTVIEILPGTVKIGANAFFNQVG